MKKEILEAQKQWDIQINGVLGNDYGQWYTYKKLIKISLKKQIESIKCKIERCKEMCFCNGLIKGDLITSQNTCANCHAREQLEEVLEELKS